MQQAPDTMPPAILSPLPLAACRMSRARTCPDEELAMEPSEYIQTPLISAASSLTSQHRAFSPGHRSFSTRDLFEAQADAVTAQAQVQGLHSALKRVSEEAGSRSCCACKAGVRVWAVEQLRDACSSCPGRRRNLAGGEGLLGLLLSILPAGNLPKLHALPRSPWLSCCIRCHPPLPPVRSTRRSCDCGSSCL